MADELLGAQNASHFGLRWAEDFVRRQLSFRMRLRRSINYQRASSEYTATVQDLFALVHYTNSKYGTLSVDIYNFDETGFLIAMLWLAKVVITSNRKGRPRTKHSHNRQRVSVIQGICADGCAIPPLLDYKRRIYHDLEKPSKRK